MTDAMPHWPPGHHEATSVLVIGGSLVGLSMATFLAWHDVPVILVERNPGISPHPRAVGYTPRTIELFRSVGIQDRIPEVPADFRLLRARVESLTGHWFGEAEWASDNVEMILPDYSISRGATIAQDGMEPILRQRALELGADLRSNTELLTFCQHDDGVTASVRPSDGAPYTIEARYLVAADGARSSIRDALGIARLGHGCVTTVRSVLFRAPLDPYLKHGVSQYEIEQPDLKAFLTTYHDGRWALMFTDDVERNETELRAAIDQAIGKPGLPVEIIASGTWELGALVAERFSSGHVFLIGDAAHALPPARGGFGANTGMADAHNLAWKLGAVLAGTSTPELLDSYDQERRPVAWQRHQQLFAQPDYQSAAQGIARGTAQGIVQEIAADEPLVEDLAMEFGQLYTSDIIIGADEDLPFALKPEEWAGQPGTRAPHLWISRDDKSISTLDLFVRPWVLLAMSEFWRDAVEDAVDEFGTPLVCIHVGSDVQADNDDIFRRAFGLGRTGASLVRPDGYIAWRSADLPIDPSETLADALAITSCAGE